MSSWYDALADRYGDWSSTSVAADVPFYVGLARDADGPLVELAVGTGRVAIPVAQATGRRVIGIDSSPAMLAQARVRAVDEGVELDLREGDIRELEIDEPAGLIYCPGRSLLHLPTWADRRRCFERVAASLRTNGRFAWNAFAFDHHVAAAIDGQHADAHAGVPLPHTNHYSVSDNRVDVTLDDGGTGSLWWATKNEWLGLLDVAGLRVEAVYGGFAGELEVVPDLGLLRGSFRPVDCQGRPAGLGVASGWAGGCSGWGAVGAGGGSSVRMRGTGMMMSRPVAARASR